MPITLASPPGACCWTGIKHTGTPEGRIEPLGGLDTYISEPPANTASGPHKRVLLFLADAYGPLFINNKLLQDYFASRGFIVLGPDYFFGVPVQNLPPDRDKVAVVPGGTATQRLRTPPTLCPSDMLLSSFFSLGTKTTKYIAVGYCFGAPFVLDLAAEGSIVAGIVFSVDAIAAHHQPFSWLIPSPTEDDFTFSLEARRRAEDILVSNESTYFFQVFSGVSHGFAVRGDPNVPHARWAKEESARGITEWFFRFAQ
ncbi:hypothetical protein J3R83DRAFT_12783 [Lanmaoa asiatica]|nr:hypothetical protein J3R83DRAFT_12783 [Lanmaoa asiatica]